jgi:hypothetical protein
VQRLNGAAGSFVICPVHALPWGDGTIMMNANKIGLIAQSRPALIIGCILRQNLLMMARAFWR